MSETLGNVCRFLNGGTPSKAVSDYFDGDIPWITSADITGPVASYARSFITDEAVKNSAVNKVAAGSVLLVTRTGVGKVAIAAKELCFSQDITALIPESERLDAGYLVHFLRTKKEYFLGLARGATIQGITRNIVSDLSIPLPPLSEQRRIAAILDQADALRAKRREALAQLDSLTQSIFIEMFGDPVSNPKGWVLSNVGALSKLQGGLQVTTARKNLSIEIPYLRVANVYRGQLDLTKMKTIKVTEAEISRTTLEKGDLLIVEGHGNPNEVGRSALWTGEITPCTHQNHIIRVRFDTSKILPIYACEYLNSPTGRRHLTGAGKTTSGLNTINASNVRGTPISVPPIALQHAFAMKFEAVKAVGRSYQMAMNESDTLFASLQHRAFRGEI